MCGLAPERYEILVPQPGVEPEPTALEGGFLTTGPLAKSLGFNYMQSTSCKIPGWMKHKLESRLLGEISITSDMQMIPHL